jgi:anti-sigma-K factor RskA
VVALVAGLNLSTRLNGQLQELTAKLSATPEIQYVAVLADDKAEASMLVTLDSKNGRLLLKRVGAFRGQADKSLELWVLPPGAAPQSPGALSADPVVRLTAAGSALRQLPTLAISLEPKGGVPPGRGSGPSGPVLFKRALIQTPP